MLSGGKTTVLALVLLVLPGTAAAVTTYDIAVQGGSAAINVTTEIYPEQAGQRERHTTTWSLPAGTSVKSVTDSDGPIEFSGSGASVTFETVISSGEEKEIVRIQGRTANVVEREYRELDLIKLPLSGLSDTKPGVPEEVTQVHVTTDRPLLSESHSFGFDAALGPQEANYSGEGPVNLRLAVGDGGARYDHFQLFGPGNLSTADDLYWVPAAVTGFLPQVNRWPVIVYPDAVYDEKVDAWSAGQYRRGGLIFIRRSTLEKDKGPAVVLHEAMHGFNEQALQWTSANRAWFDEGTASYVEWLVNAERDVRQGEIFGDEVTWREGRMQYTLPPEKKPGDLLQYYQENRTFMRDWTLLDQPERRTFGYAYSELLIRRYVLEHGPGSLRQVYSQLRRLNDQVDTEVDSLHRSNQMILTAMETGFRPCYTTDREVLEQCLDEVHDMEPDIPGLGVLENRTAKVAIQPVTQPREPTEASPRTGDNRTQKGVGPSGGLAAVLAQLLEGLLQFLTTL